MVKKEKGFIDFRPLVYLAVFGLVMIPFALYELFRFIMWLISHLRWV